jgi:hypothetical protein
VFAQQNPTGRESPDRRSIGQRAEYDVLVVRTADELCRHEPAWRDLSTAALEPNVFYEPWMLLPALEAFGGKDFWFVLVFARPPAGRPGVPLLCGLFPLERRRGYKGVPIRYLTLWQHVYAPLRLPLLRASHARGSLAAFFDWLAAGRHGCALVEFPFVPGEGPFHQLLVEDCNAHGRITVVCDCHTRALIRPTASADAYLRAAMSGDRRRNLKRMERHLAAKGRLEYRDLELGGDLGPWIDALLRLEAEGWKGRQGTALALRERDRTFFRAAVGEASRLGRLMMLGLFLDGCAIAVKCNLLAGDGAFAFRIAYDERYAAYSPGVQLEVANIRRLHQSPGVRWMDSLATWDHPMINHLWTERRVIQTLALSTGRAFGDGTVSLLPLLRWLKRACVTRKPPRPGGAPAHP